MYQQGWSHEGMFAIKQSPLHEMCSIWWRFWDFDWSWQIGNVTGKVSEHFGMVCHIIEFSRQHGISMDKKVIAQNVYMYKQI